MNRSDMILKLIVEHFIKYATPVGSQTLLDEYHLDFSSATIRMEMSNLEKEGYVEKPHTSGGRIPSNKGYKYYFANLRDKLLNKDVKMQLQSVLAQKVTSIEEVLGQSCKILADMTNLASIVIGNNDETEKLVNVQIIPLSNRSATAVFVTDKGYVENKTFIFDENIDSIDIKKCVELLNDRLRGTCINEVVEKMDSIKPLLNDYIIDHDVVYQAIMQAFVQFASDRLELYGKDQLFSQPEFSNDAEKLKQVIELLDNSKRIRQYVDVDESEQKEDVISIRIGGDECDDNVSFVSANINIDGINEGKITIVGPKRMDYDNVATLLEYVVSEINKKFKK